MSNYFEITDNCPDGARLGDSSGSLWAAHGSTPCGQQTAPTALTPATDTTSTISTAVNTLITALTNKGIIA